MAHPFYNQAKRKLEKKLAQLKITRKQAEAVAGLLEEEAFFDAWQKDDWPHAKT